MQVTQTMTLGLLLHTIEYIKQHNFSDNFLYSFEYF